MKLLIDMNLSPAWAGALQSIGVDAIHWSSIGADSAPDHEIMSWARLNGHVVFTHDLDFGTLLFHTAAAGPSVIQLRAENVRPKDMLPRETQAR